MHDCKLSTIYSNKIKGKLVLPSYDSCNLSVGYSYIDVPGAAATVDDEKDECSGLRIERKDK